MKHFKQAVYLTAVSVLCLSACAEPVPESMQDYEEKVLAAHVKLVHQDTLQKTESGLYYTVLEKGTGPACYDTALVYVRETTYDLFYSITGSTDKNIAHQLGAYSPANSYYSIPLQLGQGAIPRGLEEMLLQMRVGDKRRIWLPHWLSNYYEGGTESSTETVVYDITLERIVEDIDQYEIDTLEAFRDHYYPGLDSLERGFYFKKLTETEGDTLAFNESVTVYYVAKFLDQHVLDTNVADTATKYFISASDTYSFELSDTEVSSSDDDEATTSSSSSNTIKGFNKCLRNMHYGETAICFFHSEYGYSTTGSSASTTSSFYINGGYSVQPNTPLFYWIYIPPKEE